MGLVEQLNILQNHNHLSKINYKLQFYNLEFLGNVQNIKTIKHFYHVQRCKI